MCNAKYRPVLSSEKAPYRNMKVNVETEENLAPKDGPAPR
jgi:hypothetical protein